jgi:catechol 2,3-dioxygenase-like lactoylglutathione lyase family enzyme
MQLDSVQIGAGDVDVAAAAYVLLLGVEPTRLPGGAYRFQLAPGAVEIEPGPPGPQAIRFVAPAEPAPPESYHGLEVRLAAAGSSLAVAVDGLAIDHVVVRTRAPERAIALWRDRLGLRLALDRVFPERGVRLLFFRSGGITLEYAAPHPTSDGDPGRDRLYGISYRVPDLEARCARLLAAGVDVSSIRPGMKPGTRVASVRAGTAEVPTLLLEADPRP